MYIYIWRRLIDPITLASTPKYLNIHISTYYLYTSIILPLLLSLLGLNSYWSLLGPLLMFRTCEHSWDPAQQQIMTDLADKRATDNRHLNNDSYNWCMIPYLIPYIFLNRSFYIIILLNSIRQTHDIYFVTPGIVFFWKISLWVWASIFSRYTPSELVMFHLILWNHITEMCVSAVGSFFGK